MKKLFAFIVFLQFIFSCQSPTEKEVFQEDWIKLTKHSKLFDLFQKGDAYKLVLYESNVSNVIEKSYFFSPDSSDFAIPCNKIISLSSVFSGFIASLSQQHKITGVDNMDYISNSLIRLMFREGLIIETGADEGLLAEKIITLEPDIIIHSGSSNSLNKHSQIYENAGITAIKCHNYLEESPLGRAEWLKFFGLLTGSLPLADSLFNEIEVEYQNIVELLENVHEKPKVLTGALYGNAWDVPSGQSYAAKLIKDAGGDYLWKDEQGAGRLSLSLETVLNHASGADYWIHTNAFKSLNEMLQAESRYRHFKAFENKAVYNNIKQLNKFGGNAFWETAPVRPDIVLKDLAKIFHPNLIKNHDLVYYKQLQ